MIKFYVMLIKQGRKTINDIPAKYKEKVQEALENENN